MWAAEGVPGLDILGGSVLGIVLLLLLAGWLWAKPAVDRLVRDYERVVGENAALRQGLEEKVIPALERNTNHLEQAVRVMEDRNRRDEQIIAALDRLERR